jgi:alanine racemase
VLNWVEVDRAAIRHNVAQFRERLSDGCRFGAVVKSNAYGHGMLAVAEAAVAAGADWLCVNNADEAVALRSAGFDQPLLVMGYVPLEGLDAVVRHGLRPVVYNEETIDELSRLAVAAGSSVPVHLKLETGTHRQGVPAAAAAAMAERVGERPGLELEGLSTHFANIEDTTDHGFAECQIEAFERLTEALAGQGVRAPLRHSACSAATLLFERTHLDLVRVGISMYGVWPSSETFVSCRDRGRPPADLRPALAWKSRIAQIKPVEEGRDIGYGCTYRTTRDSRIAVLPVGYHEGYDRGLSNTAHVLIRGRRAPIRGRICMNLCMADVTDIPEAALEDEVVLLGAQGEERVSAEQLAAWCGTIPYEILARIHPGLPRVPV